MEMSTKRKQKIEENPIPCSSQTINKERQSKEDSNQPADTQRVTRSSTLRMKKKINPDLKSVPARVRKSYQGPPINKEFQVQRKKNNKERNRNGNTADEIPRRSERLINKIYSESVAPPPTLDIPKVPNKGKKKRGFRTDPRVSVEIVTKKMIQEGNVDPNPYPTYKEFPWRQPSQSKKWKQFPTLSSLIKSGKIGCSPEVSDSEDEDISDFDFVCGFKIRQKIGAVATEPVPSLRYEFETSPKDSRKRYKLMS